MNSIITPQQYINLPQTFKSDHHRVMVSGLVPMEVKSVRKVETGEFFAMVVIPVLNNRVKEIRLSAGDELVVENKETLVSRGL